jgi:hypothetical protein
MEKSQVRRLRFMRKYLIISILLALTSALPAQQALFDFTKSYFRTDPLVTEFSVFLQHLMNDPTIQHKEVQKRTDSTLFYFFGTYTDYNPFFFKPKRVEILLQQRPIEYRNSAKPDTIFVYQLTAIAGSGSNGEADVRKEFERIHRRFNKKFDFSKFEPYSGDSSTNGGLHHYFVGFSDVSPVSTAWGRLTGEYVLQITLRVKLYENRFVLAASLYDF